MKLKQKELGGYCVAVDAHRRLCLPGRVRSDLGIGKSDRLFLTLDHENVLLVFRRAEDLKEYAHNLVEKAPNVSRAEGEFLLFSCKAQARLDGRGRIAIPQDLFIQSGLGGHDVVKVIVMPNMLAIMDPGAVSKKRTDIVRRLVALNGSRDTDK